MNIKWVVFVFCAATVFSRPSATQPLPDSVHHRNDCRLARQVLTHGRPANRRAWALARLPNCGAVTGEVVRLYLQRHRADEEYNRALDEVISASIGFVDRHLADYALAVAVDPSAGTAARVQALRLIYAQVVPTTSLSYERFTRPFAAAEVVSRDEWGETTKVEPPDAEMGNDVFVVVNAALEPADLERLVTAVRALASEAQKVELQVAAERTIAALSSYQRCPNRGASARDCITRFRSEALPPS